MERARLHELYEAEIKPELRTALGLENVMDVPRLDKIVINVGVKEAVADSKAIQAVMDVVVRIAGQKPVKTLAKKSIAGFKIREDMPLGVMVTLRKRRMYEFLDRLINLALPMVRDFQGVPDKFDGRGNFNLGVRDWVVFPEVEYDITDRTSGLNITICTTAESDEHAYQLLKKFGMPFKKRSK